MALPLMMTSPLRAPLGLLTPVLQADVQPGPAAGRESLAPSAAMGTHQIRGN